MKQEQNKKIGDKKFTFTQLDPRRSYRVYLWLLGKIGTTAATVGNSGAIKSFKDLNGLKDLLNSANIDLPKLISAFGEAIGDLDDDKTVEHTDTLLSSVLCDGQDLSLDWIGFQGRVQLINKVLIEAIKWNYSDFFGGSGGLGDILEKAQQAGTKSEPAA